MYMLKIKIKSRKDINYAYLVKENSEKPDRLYNMFCFIHSLNNNGGVSYRVKTEYGVIGKSLNATWNCFDSEEKMKEYFSMRLHKKRSKGYKFCNSRTYNYEKFKTELKN